ncbi:type VI secretion system contractile sheath large subunit [Rhodovarius crocodyli]|uniref:Type VI secretion system contractile sheath large subunit n=1 Tax=Rhodovarius crocodyli TaxID=1979269 RepID=A0A437MMI4_9PROT|nr:type VI secretion system contractile sheath large subunit [Rhodovarius crocodyli]RVT98826.1 type VI secretion system contractile sheath large subunit [Rhodovarius crocodyli]
MSMRIDGPASMRGIMLGGAFYRRSSMDWTEYARQLRRMGEAAFLVLWFGEARLRAILAGPDALEVLQEAIDRDIVAIDALMARQLDQVLHEDKLRKLEGAWRGLFWLVDGFVQDKLTKVRILNARRREVERDFQRASEFDQSALFRIIHEQEFGMPGGEPYGMLVVDYEVHPSPSATEPVDDVPLLERLSEVAAASFCPVVLPVSPEFFGLDSYHEARPITAFSALFRGPEKQRWARLAQRDETRFVGLVLPRTLGRRRWSADGTRADRFRYAEDAGRADQRVWTSAVYSFASVAARSFARYHWPADVRGAEPGWDAMGGVVETLPHERFRADPPGPPPRPPLEVSLTDEQEREASDAGLIAFCGLEGLPEASFGAVPSIHRPPRMTTELANANQRLSAQFNSMLCVSRFAHVVKLMGRDMVGGFLTPEDVETRLQAWLNSHISGLAGGGDVASRYPLRDARVEVRELIGKPGVYGCTVVLQPHYQLDDVGASFRLLTELTGPREAA